MCMHNWAQGRLIRAAPRLVTLTTASTVVADADKQRVAIFFSSSNANNVHLSPFATTSASGGIGFTGRDTTAYFSLKDHGSLPQMDWSAIAEAGTPTFLVIEMFLPELALTLTTEELEKLGLA